MKNLQIAFLYIIGFIVFYLFMEMIEFDKSLYNFFNKKDNDNDRYISHSTLETNSFLQKDVTHTVLQPEDSKKPLKLSKEEIGRHSWALIHSIAAAYPSLPTPENKKSSEIFLKSLADVFPCKVCSKHFKEMLNDFPVKNNSREEFVLYLCDLHNKVNLRLNKPIYECSKAFEIWGGDCGCEVQN